ncbi:MAG TPA: DUF4132 domain-containing protein [Roseiflexaceae bacterium]|nr:DUF4132 domain-containing protein [Roseiflexaceae bacterium]
MSDGTIALAELTRLLGPDATDDALWQDLRRFEQAALPLIIRLWELESDRHLPHRRGIHDHTAEGRALNEARTEQAITELEAALGPALGRCAAAFWLNQQLWRPGYEQIPDRGGFLFRLPTQTSLLDRVAAACARRDPPLDWIARLARHMLALCTATATRSTPDMGVCITLLLQHDQSASTLLEALAQGQWPDMWDVLCTLAGRTPPVQLQTLVAHVRQRSDRYLPELVRWMHRSGRLDMPRFRSLLEALPGSLRCLNQLLAGTERAPDPEDAAFLAALRSLIDRVLWELLADLRPESWTVLQEIGTLSGGRALLRLVEEIDRRGLAQLRSFSPESAGIEGMLKRLLSQLRRRSDDDRAALVGLLRLLEDRALVAALPLATAYRTELLDALDWPGAAELVALLERLAQQSPDRSDDASAGVVARRTITELAASMDPSQMETLLEVFRSTHAEAVLLVHAALGSNRREVRRLFGRRNQLAARAMGLLPLEQPDELLQRYLALTRYEREASHSSAGRRAYERAAARAGLHNLALQAGYSDLCRLEWAMEDRLGAETLVPGRSWSIEGYTLTLTLGAAGPAIEVRNAKRLLKRTPSAVTRDYAYREVRATLEQAQQQERRYRQSLQEAMRSGQPLAPEELALLRRNPLATGLLERLVLIDAAGAVGLFCPQDCSLEGTRGERVLVSGPVTIAHPYTLAQQHLLADWQAEIVRRQIVQPFKQIFRELYLITPAELAARTSSGRLSGRQMKGRQALAVLANQGWTIDSYGHVTKPFGSLGFSASFYTGTYFFDEEDDTTITGELAFRWMRPQPDRQRTVPLDQVPPVVFSEVMRDLDLVTVIAHQSDEQGASQEVVRQRGDLVRTLVGVLGMTTRVRVEEPFVTVAGSLSGYRIHLATGACYLENGQYLCIVPGRKEQQALYLPFADGGETISSEIVSKTLLLANDGAITDPTILAQIRPLRQAA